MLKLIVGILPVLHMPFEIYEVPVCKGMGYVSDIFNLTFMKYLFRQMGSDEASFSVGLWHLVNQVNLKNEINTLKKYEYLPVSLCH